jgi:hypothetical protein
MKLLRLFALLFVPALSFAQFTTVTGTVTDPNGLAYANGTIVATLVTSASPTLNGLAYSPPSGPSGLDGSGKFTIRLGDNSVLLPGGTQWTFLICSASGTIQPAGGKGPVCFTVPALTISGSSQSITSNISAVPPPALSNNAGASSVPFSGITGGTNTTAAMVVGTGASLAASGSGAIGATSVPFSGIASSTNTTAAMVVGNGASLSSTGTGVNVPTPFRLSQLFYITASTYGAVCDGILHSIVGTDNTTAIQAAITAAQSLGSGVVIVPFGICDTSTALTITASFVSLQGQYQRGSAIQNTTAGNDILQLTGSSSIIFNEVNDLTLYRAVAGTGSSSGIKFTNVNTATITYVESWDSIHDFNQASGDANIHYRHCQSVAGVGNVTDGWLVPSSTSTYIEDSNSTGAGASVINAIHLTAGMRDLWMTHFQTASGGGTITADGVGVVTDIHCVNCTLEPGGSTVAISVTGLTSSGGVQNQIEFIGTHIKTTSGIGATIIGSSGVQFVGGDFTCPTSTACISFTSSSTGNFVGAGASFACATAPCTPVSFDNTSAANIIERIINNTGTPVTDANGTNVGAPSFFLDPSKYAWFYDDFTTGVNLSSNVTAQLLNTGGAGINWAGYTTGTSSSIQLENPSDAGTNGVYTLTSGNATGNYAAIVALVGTVGSGGGGPAFTPLGGTTFDLKFRVALGNTTSVSYFIGFVDGSGLGEANNNAMGIVFDTTQSDTLWTCLGRKTSTSTRTAITGSTINTSYHDLRIHSNVAGTILCSVDGGAEVSISTNVPTVAIEPEAIVTSRQSATTSLHIDYDQGWIAISR